MTVTQKQQGPALGAPSPGTGIRRPAFSSSHLVNVVTLTISSRQAAPRRASFARFFADFLRTHAQKNWGQWGQMAKTLVSHCHHLIKLSPKRLGTNRFSLGTLGTVSSKGVRGRSTVRRVGAWWSIFAAASWVFWIEGSMR